jgi:L-iditol 2-dehydrogenase
MVIPFEGLDYPKATLAEPITVALDLCKEGDVQLGDDILIIGPGVIGLSCVKICRLRGAGRIVVVAHSTDSSRGSYRKEVALSFGADLVIDSDTPEWKTKLKESFPRLFNLVIVTAPPQTLSDGIEMAGFSGKIVFDGIDFHNDEVLIHANDFHFAKKRLIASHAIPNWGFPIAIKLLQQEQLMSSLLLTHTYAFDSIEKAFTVFGDKNEKVIKPVVVFD